MTAANHSNLAVCRGSSRKLFKRYTYKKALCGLNSLKNPHELFSHVIFTQFSSWKVLLP